MRALDTDILVRLIAADDDVQLAAAQELLLQPFLILPTVLLETVWVLGSRYRLARPAIADRLRRILGYSLATVSSSAAVYWTLERYEAGADFADMLHLALAAEAEATSFATFDRKLSKQAPDGLPVELLG